MNDIVLREIQLSVVRMAQEYPRGTVLVLEAPAKWGKTVLADYICAHTELGIDAYEEAVPYPHIAEQTTIVMRQGGMNGEAHLKRYVDGRTEMIEIHRSPARIS